MKFSKPFVSECGITLVDFKLEFGFDRKGRLRLADELNPDTRHPLEWEENSPNR